MDLHGPPGRLSPPLTPEGLADAPNPVPAHSPFFHLGWHSIDRAERDAAAGDLARAEEGFLIAAHAFGHSRNSWLEGLAILALAAVYRLEGHSLPDWLAGQVMTLKLKPEQVEHLLDFLLLIEVTPKDSPHLWDLLADIHFYRTGGNCTETVLRQSDGLDLHSVLGGLGPSGRLAVGRRAAAVGDYDIAELAFARAANEYRKKRQPIPEAFALVELAAMYQQQHRFDRLPTLIRRARGVRNRSSLSADQLAIVQLAVELIESGRDDPGSLEIFCACWLCTDDCVDGSDS